VIGGDNNASTDVLDIPDINQFKKIATSTRFTAQPGHTYKSALNYSVNLLVNDLFLRINPTNSATHWTKKFGKFRFIAYKRQMDIGGTEEIVMKLAFTHTVVMDCQVSTKYKLQPVRAFVRDTGITF